MWNTKKNESNFCFADLCVTVGDMHNISCSYFEIEFFSFLFFSFPFLQTTPQPNYPIFKMLNYQVTYGKADLFYAFPYP